MDLLVDEALVEAAVRRISELTGRDETQARDLLEAHLYGALDLAMEEVAGSGPIATNMTSAKADHLKSTCLRAGRILTEREAEVVLRSPPSTARSVLTRMKATYEEALREQFLDHMRVDAVVRQKGNDDQGLLWEIEFTETGSFELCLSEIRRIGVPRDLIETVTTRRRITIPQAVNGVNPLAELGIAP
ncbi:MAG: hypothetical protein WD269_01375 [Acidimicrobiia bacterium]